ncbi:MAG TPA: aquaporin [Saprospiraceae bacterium]|nr:aquaporin [Saprospiraceae bacterium]
MNKEIIRQYLAEFVGTFALVFCGTGAIIINEVTQGAITHVGIAITFGFIIMSMIYTFGTISGAHFNPAVTIAFTVAKLFKPSLVLPYILSQIAGGVVASLMLKVLFPMNQTLGATLPAGSDMQSFILEIILTFFLMLVILSVSQGSKEQGMFAGLAIGGTVLLDAMFGGPVSGASMNPARSLAPALVTMNLQHLWLYLVAPVCGSLLALAVWKLTHR